MTLEVAIPTQSTGQADPGHSFPSSPRRKPPCGPSKPFPYLGPRNPHSHTEAFQSQHTSLTTWVSLLAWE